MPQIKKPQKCKACGGTGTNSRGNPCHSCLHRKLDAVEKRKEPKK